MKKGKSTRHSREVQASRANPALSPERVSSSLDNAVEAAVQRVSESTLFQSGIESLRNGWLSEGKRLKAVQRFSCQVDPDVLNGLPPITIYAPGIEVAGCVHLRQVNGLLVYLSPMLELESQKRVDFVVAHEIAHMVLGHHVPGNEQLLQHADKHEDRPAEIAASALAEKWGFRNMRRAGVFERWLINDASMTTLKHIARLVKGRS